MTRTRTLAAAAGAAVLVALSGASVSAGSHTTTAPGKKVLVYFVINDQWLRYQIYRTTAGGGTDELFLEKYVVRGDQAQFIFINRGKKAHGIEFYGHKFSLKPGKRAHFSTPLLKRGSFAYESTTDRGKAFRGKFAVL